MVHSPARLQINQRREHSEEGIADTALDVQQAFLSQHLAKIKEQMNNFLTGERPPVIGLSSCRQCHSPKNHHVIEIVTYFQLRHQNLEGMKELAGRRVCNGLLG